MATKPKLSKRAIKLLNRLYDEHFYPHTGEDAKEGSAMRELIDAGLVVSGGRVAVIRRCYMPVGVKPFKVESYPDRPKWLHKINAEALEVPRPGRPHFEKATP